VADDPTFARGPAGGSERRRVLLTVGTTALIIASAAVVAGWPYWSEHPLRGVACALVSAAALAVALRRRLAVAAAADRLLRLARPPTAHNVREALRTMLREPSLDVYFWLPQQRHYVDVGGRLVTVPRPREPDLGGRSPCDPPSSGGPEEAAPESGPCRWLIQVAAPGGGLVATVDVDAALRARRPLVDATLSAASVTLANARLQSVLHGRLTRIAGAQRRVAAAEAAERQRIEQNLHDGVQQRLLVLDIKAGLVEESVAGTRTAAAVSEIRGGLRAAHRQVREVARGLHPAVLARDGLGPALGQVRDDLGVAATLTVPDRRFAPGVERILYVGLSEALTNVVRHAAASTMAVTVELSGDTVVGQVCDDGVGGARCVEGGGLARVVDRACAAGGRVEIDSPPGSGTLVRIVLPCG
jgi:signal transduction histidine kinase